MKKIYSALVAATIASFATSNACALSNVPQQLYLQISGYGNKLLDGDLKVSEANQPKQYSLDSGIGYGGGASLGFKLNQFLRAEAEASVIRYKLKTPKGLGTTGIQGIDDEAIYAKSAMANLLIDMPLTKNFVPYFGGGGGLVYLGNAKDFNNDDTSYAYQLMTGLSIAMSESSSLVLGYKYMVLGKANKEADIFTTVSDPRFTQKMHVAQAGVRFRF